MTKKNRIIFTVDDVNYNKLRLACSYFRSWSRLFNEVVELSDFWKLLNEHFGVSIDSVDK